MSSDPRRKSHSCVSCRKRKASCDRLSPACTPCLSRSHECVYPSFKTRYQVSRGRSCTHCQRRRMKCDRGRPCASCRRTDLVCSYGGQENGSLDGSNASASRPTAEAVEQVDTPSEDQRQVVPDTYPSMLLGSHTTLPNTNELHPPVAQVWTIFNVYLDNVDPLLKIFHAPSFQKQLVQAVQNMGNIDADVETLLFAIYFSAVVSLREEDCISTLNESKVPLLQKYRFGLERCLLRSNFLSTPTLAALQAFVLYLATTFHAPLSSPKESLLAIAIQLARKLDLQTEQPERHSYALKFTTLAERTSTEMRRRLWWHIMALDVQVADDTGRDPLIWEGMWTAKMPSNMDDVELDAASDLPLPPRAGETFDADTYMIVQNSDPSTDQIGIHDRRTDVSFALLRMEVSYAMRRFAFSEHFCHANGYDFLYTLEERVRFLEDLVKDVDRRYLQFCNRNDMFSFFERNAAKLILSCHLLMVKNGQPAEVFHNSVLVLEAAAGMRRTHKKWAWSLRSHVELPVLGLLWKSLGNMADLTGPEHSSNSSNVNIMERLRHAWTLAEIGFQRGIEDELHRCYGDQWARISDLRDIAIVNRDMLATS